MSAKYCINYYKANHFGLSPFYFVKLNRDFGTSCYPANLLMVYLKGLQK